MSDDKRSSAVPGFTRDSGVISMREPGESWKANIFWGLVFGIPLVVPWPDMSPLERYGFTLAGLVWMGFMGYWAIRHRGLTVRTDDKMIEVSQPFGTRRIALSDVKKVTRRDLGRQLRDLDKDLESTGEHSHWNVHQRGLSGTLAAPVRYVLYDAKGAELLALRENIEPAREMQRFLNRLQNLTGEPIRDEEPSAGPVRRFLTRHGLK